MEKIIKPNYDKYKEMNDLVGFWYQAELSNKVSLGIFAVDFNEKLKLAVQLLREHFQTNELDKIAYDIVKSYCLSEQYRLYDVGDIDATNKFFYEFFEKYIENLEKITKGISDDLSTHKGR